MVNDDELFSSFVGTDLGATPMVHAENGDVIAELSMKLFQKVIVVQRLMHIPNQAK